MFTKHVSFIQTFEYKKIKNNLKNQSIKICFFKTHIYHRNIPTNV